MEFWAVVITEGMMFAGFSSLAWWGHTNLTLVSCNDRRLFVGLCLAFSGAFLSLMTLALLNGGEGI